MALLTIFSFRIIDSLLNYRIKMRVISPIYIVYCLEVSIDWFSDFNSSADIFCSIDFLHSITTLGCVFPVL